MSEAPEVTFAAPAKKKAPAKKRKPVRAAASPRDTRPSAPFPGLTRLACASACNANGCVISGRNYCAHPTKGGLQGADMGDSAALKRMQAARDQIDVRLDPDRFK